MPWDIKSASLENLFPAVERSSVRFGRMPSNPAILGCPPTSCCSVTFTSHWRIITGSSSIGCHILRFGRITLHVCECLCHRKRPWHSVIWRPPFRPALFQHAMLTPLRWSPSRLGKPDVPIAGFGLLVFGTNRSVSSFQP